MVTIFVCVKVASDRKGRKKGSYDDSIHQEKNGKKLVFCYFYLFVRHHYPLITVVMVFVTGTMLSFA